MPDISDRQRRAMFAAKDGKSTIGIPQNVGQHFIAADKAAGMPKLPESAPKKKKHTQDVGEGTSQGNDTDLGNQF